MKRYIGTMLGFALGLVLGLTASVASPASATPAEAPIVVERSDCESTVLSTARPTGWIVVSTPDGVVKSAAAGASVEVGPFGAPTTLKYRLFGGGERDHDYPLWSVHHSFGEHTNTEMKAIINAYADEVGGFGWTTASPDDTAPFVTWKKIHVRGCVTPEAPTPPAWTCDAFTDAVLLKQDGVKYEQSDWTVVVPGTFESTVVASPKRGYGFPGDVQVKWVFTVDSPVCSGPAGPPGPPGTDGDDGQDGADGADGQDGQDGQDGISGVAASNTGQLPMTSGSRLPAFVLIGLSLLLLGGGLMLATVRKRKARFTA